MNLTDRDCAILCGLVFDDRAASEEQILLSRFPETDAGRKNGQRRLREICAAGLLDRQLLHVKDVRRVELLSAGGPDEPAPDCAELSRRAQSAWNALPVRPVVVYTATRRGRLIFGGRVGHRVRALPQVSHDLGVAACRAALLRTEPELAARWQSEDEGLLPAGFGDCQPDAVLVGENKQPEVAVEFASGHYTRERFERLLQTFTEQGLKHLIYGAQP